MTSLDSIKPRSSPEPGIDVFISYAHADVEFARALASTLASSGLSVWFDQGALRVSDEKLRGIEQGLERSRAFVLLLSESYVTSVWAPFEIGVAVARRRGPKDVSVLAVLVPGAARDKVMVPWTSFARSLDANELSLDRIAREIASSLPERNATIPKTMDRAARIRALYEGGRAAWPELHLTLDEWTTYVEARLGVEDLSVEGVDVAGLYIACACLADTPGAIESFERHFLSGLDGQITGLKSAPDLVDEAVQDLRAKLFVRGPDGPAIGRYKGRVPLASWVRVLAQRTALSLLRTRTPVGKESEKSLESLLADEPSPEQAILANEFRQELKDALHAAISRLSATERTMLRLSVVEGLSLEKIAAMYRLNASTASRWLTNVRQKLLEAMRETLREGLNLRREGAEEILELLREESYEVDISLGRAFAEESRKS